MAKVDYAKVAKKVTKALEMAGTKAELSVPTPGTYDPVTDTYTGGGVPTLHEFKGIQFQITEEFIKETDPSLIEVGDTLIYGDVPDGFPDPESGQIIVFVGKDYKIASISPVNPTGIPVLYQYQVRSAA